MDMWYKIEQRNLNKARRLEVPIGQFLAWPWLLIELANESSSRDSNLIRIALLRNSINDNYLFGVAVLFDGVVIGFSRLQHPQKRAQRENGSSVSLENLRVERFSQHLPVYVRSCWHVIMHRFAFAVHRERLFEHPVFSGITEEFLLYNIFRCKHYFFIR